jgi:NAD(P)-dependent dehydrogenase (short-subunit alcohol dehydrogenase family)
MTKFAGRTAFITGSGQGIGYAFAEALLAEGAAVGVLDIDVERGEAAVKTLSASGGKVGFAGCDVADESNVNAAVAKLAGIIGDADILINCAARHLSFYSQPCTQLPRDHWRLMLEVNVIGIVNCAAACRDGMRRRGGGVVINISSIASFMLNGAYGVSKLAVRGLTVALAQEFAADGIRVCGIAPGLVDSPSAVADVAPELVRKLVEEVQLIKRPGKMTDLVGALFYLCSHEAGFVTGETLIVGGGFPLRP